MRILIASTGPRNAFVIAVMPAPDSYTSGARLVVGQLYRTSPDGEPEAWRAWLWPSAGGVMHVTQHCDAVGAATPEQLRERLQARVDKSVWWALS